MSRHTPVIVSFPSYQHGGFIEVAVTSFGYLHGPVPEAAAITVDVRKHLRDPHADPAFRALTGHDPQVIEKVLTTPGAAGLVDGLTAAVVALAVPARTPGLLVRVAVGCAGGRHRSVVIADAVAARVALAGHGAEVEHRDLNQPVVDR